MRLLLAACAVLALAVLLAARRQPRYVGPYELADRDGDALEPWPMFVRARR